MRYLCVCVFLLLPAIFRAEGAVRIGTCNVAKVFESLDERKAVETDMKTKVGNHNAEVARRRKAIEELQGQRDELKPESPLYQQKTEELVSAATQLEVLVKLKQDEMMRLEKQHMARLYDQVRQACKAAAGVHKLDLVVAERPADSAREMNRLTGDQLRLLLSTSEVLFASNEVDLTQEVILELNKQFAATAAPAKP
jgi:Skp family chaperone for outer membrane proteins